MAITQTRRGRKRVRRKRRPLPRRDPETLLPLTPAAFHILLVLARGKSHGYVIMQEVAQETEGAIRLGPGTAYRSLQYLEQDGLIDEMAPSRRAGDDPRRRYYRLTALGRRVVARQAERFATLVQLARQRGLLKGR